MAAELRRCGSISSPSSFAVAALLLVLLVAGCFHCTASARLLPPSSVPAPALLHQAENGVKAAGAADGGLVVLQEGGVGNGEELSMSEMMGAESEEEEEAGVACEEGNDECMQRRQLHDAHLDYIYTQHKGKP